MSRTPTDWWDRFWVTQARETPSAGGLTWEGLTCRVALDFWTNLFAQRSPGRDLLECGAGTARLSAHLARHGYRCTMLDRSERGLEQGRERFRQGGLSGAFVCGDVGALGFGDGTFDVVYTGGMLEFLEDVPRAICEMVRVLRPGGVFAASIVPDKWSVQTIADVERTMARCVKRLCTGRVREAFQRVESVPASYAVSRARLADYVDLCRRAGLASVVGRGTTPFPALALPGPARPAYARAMAGLRSTWEWFDASPARWTEYVGIGYRVYGTKPR